MEESQTERLVEKVQHLLQQTDAYKWEMADKPLTTDVKVPRPMERWERVYSLNTPEGTLVIRSSQPVRANFVSGGYLLVATASEEYIVEMRAKGWRALEITEPWRGYAIADKKYQRLLDGEVAKEFFFLVRERIRTYEQDEKKSFDEKTQEFIKKIPEVIQRMKGEDWERQEPTLSERRYIAEFGELKVSVVRRSQLGNYVYGVTVEKGPLKVEGKDAEAAKNVFFEIEKLHHVSGLLVLGKALEGLNEKKSNPL